MFSTTILSNFMGELPVKTGLRSKKVQPSYMDNVAIGEAYEDAVRRYFESCGLRAETPRQKFDDPYDYPKYQRDIDLWTPQGTLLHIEVKSRTSPFQWASVDVGKTRSWDAKQFQTTALVIVDQATLEAVIGPVDFDLWLVRQNLDRCYSVPKRYLSPLETFVDAVKEGLYEAV
jgi:hypothetical protein